MGKITSGAACATITVTNERIAHVTYGGVLTPANAGDMAARVLRASVEMGATAVLSELRAAVVLPPIAPQHYSYVPEELRVTPIAVRMPHAGLLAVYGGITGAAAVAGLSRRAFLSSADAAAWLREQQEMAVAMERWRASRPAHLAEPRKLRRA